MTWLPPRTWNEVRAQSWRTSYPISLMNYGGAWARSWNVDVGRWGSR